MSNDCQAQKYSHHKKFEKAEKAFDGDGYDLVLCLMMSESKKGCKKNNLVCEGCKTALKGWYDLNHQW